MKSPRMPRNHNEAYHDRRFEGNKKTSDTHHHRSVVKVRNRKDEHHEQNHRKKTEETFSRHISYSKQHKISNDKNAEKPAHRSSRHQNSHQNSTHGASLRLENVSSGSEIEIHHRRGKRGYDSPKTESYEELSRRKRKIESELHALDLEEAAEREEKKSSRNGNAHRGNEIRTVHRETEIRTVRIKKEPVEERPRESHKRRSPPQESRHSTQDNHRNKHRRLSPSQSPKQEKDWGNKTVDESKKVGKPIEKPNFSVSGKLAEDTNTYNGVVIKYNEPGEARKPRRKWRLYPFKGDTSLPFIPVHRQSAYLFGRTRLIADIPIDHPSCSKQHAVLQFRLVPYEREDGSSGRRVRPYMIDLESSNGTFVNNKKIEPRRYVELMEKDVVKFGFSSREYVILHEESKNDFEDDDVLEDKSD